MFTNIYQKKTEKKLELFEIMFNSKKRDENKVILKMFQ